jgi:hypothetical protein
MNSCRCLVAALLLPAALAGCSGPQVRTHIDSVNSEYRQLEDYVYCLEDENAKLERRLNHVQDNYERVLRGEAPRRPGSTPPKTNGSSESSGSGDLTPPEIEPGTPTTPPASKSSRSSVQRPSLPVSSSKPLEKLDLGPPVIDIPGASDESAPKTDKLPTPAVPRAEQPAAPQSLPVSLPESPADTRVTHVSLNPLLTGGADFDRQPGDEGLSIVLEPRNAADQYVPQAGAVSIVVLDPAKQGEAARIARWDFTLSATQQKLQTASVAKGIQLEMPWPASPPTTNQLKVFVRYETADGRRLQTDREIFITPPGQVVQRWTPRPADRPRAETAAVGPPAPAAAPAPAIVSKLPAASATPQLLTPPPAAIDQPKAKVAAPKWSPYR